VAAVDYGEPQAGPFEGLSSADEIVFKGKEVLGRRGGEVEDIDRIKIPEVKPELGPAAGVIALGTGDAFT